MVQRVVTTPQPQKSSPCEIPESLRETHKGLVNPVCRGISFVASSHLSKVGIHRMIRLLSARSVHGR